MKTEFYDKNGKPLYIGDIILYFLSGIGSGGPAHMKITRNKKGVVRLSAPNNADKNGWILRKTYEKYITLIDTSGRESKYK